jgi:hypothetical protein
MENWSLPSFQLFVFVHTSYGFFLQDEAIPRYGLGGQLFREVERYFSNAFNGFYHNMSFGPDL